MPRPSRPPSRRTPAAAPSRLEELRTELMRDPPAAADVVSADTDVGPLLLHAADEVMTPIVVATHAWEPAEAAWLRGVLRSGQTVLDVGANVGYFTLLAAKAVGPEGSVVAVEPDAANLRLLRANVWRNACDNVRILAGAAAGERGLLALRRNAANAGDHQVHAAARPGDVLVPAFALDDVLDGPRLDVVKIDTQGCDHLVVAGLRRTLRASPDAQLLIEFWPQAMDERGIDAAAVLHGYRALGRPLGVLADDGVARPAGEDDVLGAAREAPLGFLNLVLGRAR